MENMPIIIRLIFEADNEATYSIQCIVDGRTQSRLLNRNETCPSIYTESQFIKNVGYLEKLIKDGHVSLRLNEADTPDVEDVLKYINSVSPTIFNHLSKDLSVSDLGVGPSEQARHWLVDYPDVLQLYEQAIQKQHGGLFLRNLLDDMRLALEKLLHSLFNNHRSLENQLNSLGDFIKQNSGSPELANMFVKLVDYYSKYQNTYVKHDDSVIDAEVDFILEITSSFMKHLIKLNN